jgi:hypothetical protein
LRAAGQLQEAFSPGGSGAVLILDSPNTDAARRITETLPLYRAGLIETEIIELHVEGAIMSKSVSTDWSPASSRAGSTAAIAR